MSRSKAKRRRIMAAAREAVRRSYDGWDLAGRDEALCRAIEIERPAWAAPALEQQRERERKP